MKNYRTNSKRLSACIGMLCLLTLLLSSCLKDNNNYVAPPVALVTFIQASPDEPPLNFFLNNNKVNFSPLNYGDALDYFRAYVGVRTANFNNAFTNSQILSDTIRLNQNTDYSLFLANKATKPEILLLVDSLSQPAAGKATVRFVNLSPDAPAVSLAITGSQVLATNIPYKGHTPFLPVAGNATYTFEVRQGTTATVLATLPNITLSNGFVYTIWFHGLAASTSAVDNLKADILTNAIYY